MSSSEEWLRNENTMLRSEVAFLKRELEKYKWGVEDDGTGQTVLFSVD